MRAQIDAGAKMIFVAEPAGAANYISPVQMAEGSDVFSRFVIGSNLRLKAELTSAGVEMFLCVLLEVGNSGIPCLFSLDVPPRLRVLREKGCWPFLCVSVLLCA